MWEKLVWCSGILEDKKNFSLCGIRCDPDAVDEGTQLSVCNVIFTMFYLFQYYAESHGVIYVIDSTDEERLGESKNAFGEFCSAGIDQNLSLTSAEEKLRVPLISNQHRNTICSQSALLINRLILIIRPNEPILPWK